MDRIEYFRAVAHIVKERSKCLSRKIGAVIANGDTIISTGYNGPPRGMAHCDKRHLYDSKLKACYDLVGFDYLTREVTECPRRILGYQSGEGLDLCPAVHAEVNAIINAGRNGVSCVGASMYLTCEIPCKNCLIAIVNAGIEKVYIENRGTYDDLTSYVLSESNLLIQSYH